MTRRAALAISPELDQKPLAETYLHPVRGKVLSAVAERPGSTVAEIARRLGRPPRSVRHHLKVLVDQDLIEETASVDGRGASIGFATDPIRFDDYARIGEGLQPLISRDIVRLLIADISVAASAGTFATRRDDHAVRFYGEVDDACLGELATIHERAYMETVELFERHRGRRPAAGQPGMELVSAHFLFEAPLWGRSSPEGTDGRQAPPTVDSTPSGAGGVPHGPPVVPSPEEAETLIAAMTHPLRGRILTALAERPGATIREIAARLGESPRRVRHGIEVLLSSGLAVVTDESLGRGVLVRRYGARPWVVEGGGEVDATDRLALSKVVIRMLMGDLGAAAEAGALGTSAAEYQVRIYVEVDEAGRTELVDVHRRAYPEILEAIEAGRERVRRSGEPGTEIVSALFLFEAPLWNGSGTGG